MPIGKKINVSIGIKNEPSNVPQILLGVLFLWRSQVFGGDYRRLISVKPLAQAATLDNKE